MKPDCAITVQSGEVCARQEACCRIPDAVPPQPSVTVPAAVAGDVLRLLVLGLDALVRKDGGEVSPRARALLLELDKAAQAYDEGAVPPSEPSGAPSVTVEVSVAEAARVIGSSREYVRRLCRREVLPARRIGHQWLITIERKHLDQDE